MPHIIKDDDYSQNNETALYSKYDQLKVQLNSVSNELSRAKTELQKNYQKIKLLSVATFVIVALFLVINGIFQLDSEKVELQSKYFTQHLKGDKIYTWKSWNLAENEPLFVNVVYADGIDKEKINIIKEIILSEEKVHIFDESSDEFVDYYKGWIGALNKATEFSTKYNVPTKFEITESKDESGDIVIFLSNLKDKDGITGLTKSTVDDNFILKSYITINDVNNLSDKDLATITRHEFGHALGLGHSTDQNDLMHPTIVTSYPFISECNISALVSLYNGMEIDNVTCEI